MEDDNFLKFNVKNCDGINDVAILLKDKGIIEDISFYLYGSELGNEIGRASCRERVSSPV